MRILSERCTVNLGRPRERVTLAPAYRRLRREAEKMCVFGLRPPAASAGFYHDYFCPAHGVQLTFDARSPRRHLCPVDGTVFTGELFDSAWRWFVNNRLSEGAWILALNAHAYGDEVSRAQAVDILCGYAERYRSYRPADGRARKPGRATFQSLDEAVWLLPLVRAYDLLRDRIDTERCQRIERDLLRPAADHIRCQRFESIHNIECWHNAALAAVGLCLDDAELVHTALDGEFGFLHQLEEGVRADGLWWEGSLSYHYYATAALLTTTQVAEPVRSSLIECPRLQRMLRAPIDLAYPDGRLPATNDCWFFTSLRADVCHGIPAAAALYEIGYTWYGDESFAHVLMANYRTRPRDSLEALLYGNELPQPRNEPEPVSANLDASGLAMLRSASSDSCVLLKYGPHGGSHGHPDKLSIALHLCGEAVAPDLGTPGYGIDLHDNWYRQSLSHNTVVIDGCSQPATSGELIAFQVGKESGFDVVDAAVRWQEAPYDGVEMRRTLLLVSDYLIDLFEVSCPASRQLDWILRMRGQREELTGFSAMEPTVLSGDGYENVVEPQRADAETEASVRWRLAGAGVALHLPHEESTEIIMGDVPFNPAADSSELMIRRRQTRSTCFCSVLTWYEEKPHVKKVTLLDAELPPRTWGLVVETTAEKHCWTVGDTTAAGRISGESGRLFRYAR